MTQTPDRHKDRKKYTHLDHRHRNYRQRIQTQDRHINKGTDTRQRHGEWNKDTGLDRHNDIDTLGLRHNDTDTA